MQSTSLVPISEIEVFEGYVLFVLVQIAWVLAYWIHDHAYMTSATHIHDQYGQAIALCTQVEYRSLSNFHSQKFFAGHLMREN